jgi:hypothetical protein
MGFEMLLHPGKKDSINILLEDLRLFLYFTYTHFLMKPCEHSGQLNG